MVDGSGRLGSTKQVGIESPLALEVRIAQKGVIRGHSGLGRSDPHTPIADCSAGIVDTAIILMFYVPNPKERGTTIMQKSSLRSFLFSLQDVSFNVLRESKLSKCHYP